MSSLFLATDFLRTRRNSKWMRYPVDVLPSWIADMDFAVAEPIQRAIERVAREHDYGYPRRASIPAESIVATAFAARMAERFGWQADAARVQSATDVIQALAGAILAFSEPGDGVVVQTPCYPPFRETVAETGRAFIDNPLRDTPAGFVQDFEALEASINSRTRMLLLCNPQNPTGRVYRREELARLAEIAERHDLVIFSDEIHADLTYEGFAHIPMASLGPVVAARTITATSATKSFNLPGLRCAVMHFGSAALRERFHKRVPKSLMGKPSIFGIDATVAAWTKSSAWLDEVKAHLAKLRDRLASAVEKDMPGIRMHKPEATFLAWLDCTGLGLKEPAYEYFLREAKIGFNPGESFSPGYEQWVRFNLATTDEVFDEKVARMVRAVAAKRAA